MCGRGLRCKKLLRAHAIVHTGAFAHESCTRGERVEESRAFIPNVCVYRDNDNMMEAKSFRGGS
ncbi:hypothetical protein DL93DRAFT_2073771 [Clavulina sp. PMI_390]|nr:hypothetical protein DL93DRAFT_2073771 [Clavulina sp. PMI_390]